MKRSKPSGKMLALSSIAVIAFAGFRLGPYALETWKIHQLGSDDPSVRDAAAQWLGEHKSVRAVPRLIDAFRQMYPVPPPIVIVTNPTADPPDYLSPVEAALVQIGEPAARVLVKSWHLPGFGGVNPYEASRLVERIGADAHGLLTSCLREHIGQVSCLGLTLQILSSQTRESTERLLQERVERETPEERRRTLETARALRALRAAAQASGTLQSQEFEELLEVLSNTKAFPDLRTVSAREGSR
ncbi:MAG: hypothetical protein AAF517_10545 [Planctomycetota bacterium]